MIIRQRFSSSSFALDFFGYLLESNKLFSRRFFSRLPARKEIRNNLFYKIASKQASERARKIILTMGMFFPVKCFHDEIELRVKLNLPSGHSQRVYFVSFPHSPQLDSHKLCRRRLRTILHRFRLCIFSYWSCVRRDVLALSHPTVL